MQHLVIGVKRREPRHSSLSFSLFWCFFLQSFFLSIVWCPWMCWAQACLDINSMETSRFKLCQENASRSRDETSSSLSSLPSAAMQGGNAWPHYNYNQYFTRVLNSHLSLSGLLWLFHSLFLYLQTLHAIGWQQCSPVSWESPGGSCWRYIPIFTCGNKCIKNVIRSWNYYN